MSYSQLVEMKSLIPKVIDKITMDNWFRDSDSLAALVEQLVLRFGAYGDKVSQEDYLEVANQAEALAIELVMGLSYGDLIQLLCENPWMLTTEAELELLEVFQEKLGKVTIASLTAVVLCEYLYAELMQGVECLL